MSVHILMSLQQSCPVLSMMYIINLEGYDTVQARKCVSASCNVVFTEFPMNSDMYDLRIVALNNSNTIKEFRLTVGKQNKFLCNFVCLCF